MDLHIYIKYCGTQWIGIVAGFVTFVCLFFRILHPSKPPLDIGTTYWSLRESIIQCELFLARALQFQFAVDHPHKVSI